MPNITGKKGLSDVVAVVFIIVLGLISVTLLWQAIRPSIDLSPEFICAEARIDQPFTIEKACYNALNEEVELTIRRSPTDSTSLTSLEFTIGQERFYCGAGCEGATLPKAGETKTYYFDTLPAPDSIILGANDCQLISQPVVSC